MENWIKLSKESGKGNATIDVLVQEYTGRLQRSAEVHFISNEETIIRHVFQDGKPEYVLMEDFKKIGKEGGIVTINGTSNSRKLTFSLGSGNLDITIPSTYLVNGSEIINGELIDGDIGATSVYNFSIQILVPSNHIPEVKTKQIIVTDEIGNQNVCELQLAEEDVKPDYSSYRGVFVQTIDGWLYNVEDWTNSKVANGIAVITDKTSFVVALNDAYSKYCTWGTRSNISGVNNSDNKTTIKSYYNGEAETDAIIKNAASSVAASYCKNFIFPNGQNGYMAAAGEWWICATYKQEIDNAMSACGTIMKNDYWCTTEQVGSNRAWALDWEGADLTNYNKSASSSVRVRALCRLIY